MIYTDKIHLVADTLDELHEFALKIGLKREWFQNHPKHPHYDIWGTKVKIALENNAKLISSKEIVVIANKLNK